jgi:hypothetical protein
MMRALAPEVLPLRSEARTVKGHEFTRAFQPQK